MTPNLKSLQALLYRAITAEPGAIPALDGGVLSRVIRGDKRLSAVERIAIYADAYFYRLLECLKEDFPATAAVIGGPVFEDVVRAYLTRHPPTEPSIFYAGRRLSDFLADHRLREHWPFLAELARFERALIEVFHDPDAQPLTAQEMRGVAPARWPGLLLSTIPALQILACKWRVSDVVRAVESGSAPKEPACEPTTTLVWRQSVQVYYRELKAPERAALEAASKGADFATVCEVFASRLDGEDPAAATNAMLTRWLADGLLVRG